MERIYRDQISPEELGRRFFAHMRQQQEAACRTNKWWYLGTAIAGLLLWGTIHYLSQGGLR